MDLANRKLTAKAQKRSDSRRKSMVNQTAQRLREKAMQAPEGALLGSEEDLMNALEISRPTLRQAASMLAQEQLVTIRRGVNGGYFAASPDSSTVAHMAAIFLQSRNAKLIEVIEAVEPIKSAIITLACRRIDHDAKVRLEAFIAVDQNADGDYRTFLRAERTFGKLLGDIGGNNVLSLFLAIVYDLTASLGKTGGADVYVGHPERIAAYRAQRNRVVLAMIGADEEIAVIEARRCSAMVTSWIEEDLAAHPARFDDSIKLVTSQG